MPFIHAWQQDDVEVMGEWWAPPRGTPGLALLRPMALARLEQASQGAAVKTP